MKVSSSASSKRAKDLPVSSTASACHTLACSHDEAIAKLASSSTHSANAFSPHTTLCSDTGCSSTMTPHRDWFVKYREKRVRVRVASGQIIYSAGIGSIVFQPVKNGTLQQPVVFDNVLHVPELSTSLLSVLTLSQKQRYQVLISQDTMQFTQDGHQRFTATSHGELSYLDGYVIPAIQQETAFFVTPQIDARLVHRQLHHCGAGRLRKLYSKKMADDLPDIDLDQLNEICESCLAGKFSRTAFASARRLTASRVGQYVFTDLKGPLPTSHDGYKYWAVYVDYFSKFKMYLLLKNKSQQKAAYQQVSAFYKTQTGHAIQHVFNDAGGEYTSNEWLQILSTDGTQNIPTPTETPALTGLAENANKSALQAITAMLDDAKLPSFLWSEALRCYQDIDNKLPTKSLSDKTPFECFYGQRPSLKNIHVFGSVAYTHILKKNRTTFQPRMMKLRYLSPMPGNVGYRLWNFTKRQLVLSRDVIFDERPLSPDSPDRGGDRAPAAARAAPAATRTDRVESEVSLSHSNNDSSNDDWPAPAAQPPPAPSATPLPPSPAPEEPRRSARTRQPPQEFWKVQDAEQYRSRSKSAEPLPYSQLDLSEDEEPADETESQIENEDEIDASTQCSKEGVIASHVAALECTSSPLQPTNSSSGKLESRSLTANDVMAFAFAATSGNPLRWEDCLARDDREDWIKARDHRLSNLEEQKVFELVPRPVDKRVLKIREIFTKKPDRYQVRVAAQGVNMLRGRDYFESFSPVISYDAIRLCLSIAAYLDLDIDQIDYSAAYLNAPLLEEVYTEQPKMFNDGTGRVWRLLKALEGLPQSGRQWNKTLEAYVIEQGFEIMLSLPACSLYRKGDIFCLIPTYVDDQLLICNNEAFKKQLIQKLNAKFPLKHMGAATTIVGITIRRDRKNRLLYLSSSDYIKKITNKFRHFIKRPCRTPMLENLSLSKEDAPSSPEEIEEMKGKPYLELAGNFNWMTITSRPDGSFATSLLLRHSSHYGRKHWDALVHLLSYFDGTADYELCLGQPASFPLSSDGSGVFNLQAFADASYGDCKDDGKSTGGHVLFCNGSAISWSAKKQPVVAQSTMEAELIAANTAGRNLIYTRQALNEMGFKQKKASILWSDNAAAIQVAKDPQHRSRAKHISLRYFWIRQVIEQGKIVIKYVRTEHQVADLFTKALGKNKLRKFIKIIGLAPRDSTSSA